MSDTPALATVLLVHGFCSSAEASWRRNPWMDLLADAGRTVVAPDLLGHGTSEKPHDPAAYEDGLEAGIVAALPPGPIDAVGFSMGARALLVIASRNPGTFQRIVVGGIGANLFAPPDPTGHDVVASAIAGEREALDPLSRAFAEVARVPPNDPLALAACIRRRQPVLGEAELARVTCPVLVVAGAEDPIAIPADRLVDALPDSRLEIVKGADHLGTMKGFGFLDAALGFLDALP